MVHLVREIYHHDYSWKDLKLSELGELYISMMIKTLGLSLIGIFVPIYLYELGYGIDEIALFFAFIFSVRIITDLIAAKIVGYFGPKHVMILSHIFLIITFSLLLSLETYSWSLVLIGITDAIATGMFFIAYHIEFSKIQSSKKAGKQIGNMFKVGKFASAIGPLIGGVLATVYGVQVVIILAMILIFASAIPLSLSPEPVRKKQIINFKGFPWREVKWDIVSNLGLAFDQMANAYIWPLYVSIYIFTGNVYLSVGIITSIGLAMSVVVASLYGRMIDNAEGNKLLKLGILGVSLSHLVRLIITSPFGVYAINFVGDPVSIAVRMPYTKGMYGAASSHKGYRDAYIGLIVSSTNIMRALVFLLIYFITTNGSEKFALQSVFIVAAISIWMVSLHKFKVLRT